MQQEMMGGECSTVKEIEFHSRFGAET